MTSPLPGPDVGLGSWPRRRARITPDRPALIQAGRTLTYSQLADRTQRLAGALAALGVQRGDRVAYLGINGIETFETLFATGQLGAVFVPLNTRLSGPEVRYLLADCAPTVLVHSADTDALVAAAGPLPEGVRHVLAIAPDSSPVSATAYAAAIDDVAAVAPMPAVGLDDPALMLYTSGTTGTPKGAVLTHGNLTWNTMNQLAHFDTLSTDRALCIAPLFHVVGLGQVTLPTLFKGGSVEILPRFDAASILATIHEKRITSFSAVPTMLQMMTESPSWETADISSLTCVVYGGSAVQERVAKAWLARGIQVLQGYGMTEAAPGVYMAIKDGALARPVSVGLPHFFTDVALLSPEGPVPMRPDAPGELLIRGLNVFTGYWNRPDATADSFVDSQWFRTGDVVQEGGDGWAYVVDRVKDMIISGGENIYPAEVEAVIVALDEVSTAAVVAVPDARWGEVGAGYVVLREGATLTEAQLRQHLETNLARFKIPKYLRFVPDIPHNATGKIRRVELRTAAAAEHDGQE